LGVVPSDVEVGYPVVVYKQSLRPRLVKTQHDHNSPEKGSSGFRIGKPKLKPLRKRANADGSLETIRHGMDHGSFLRLTQADSTPNKRGHVEESKSG